MLYSTRSIFLSAEKNNAMRSPVAIFLFTRIHNDYCIKSMIFYLKVFGSVHTCSRELAKFFLNHMTYIIKYRSLIPGWTTTTGNNCRHNFMYMLNITLTHIWCHSFPIIRNSLNQFFFVSWFCVLPNMVF